MPESMEQTIEILLIDDHTLFREGVSRLLGTEPAFKVIACGSIKEGLAVLRQQQIDIVLLDFDLGQRDGTRFVRLAKEQGFEGKILVVTAGVEEREAAELIRCGISGIFMKHNSAALLAQGSVTLWQERSGSTKSLYRPPCMVVHHHFQSLKASGSPSGSVRFFRMSSKASPTRKSRHESASPRARLRQPYSSSSQRPASTLGVNWFASPWSNTTTSSSSLEVAVGARPSFEDAAGR